MALPIDSDFLKLAQVEESNKQKYIDYTSQDFDSIKQSVLEYVQAVYPLDYNNFIESDFGIMLIEVLAYIGAMNTFKADFNAHQNFIRLARRRSSVSNLLSLIGVSLKGPTAAYASARLTVENDSVRIRLQPNDRTVSVKSPEDGSNVVYTLYKTVNGKVDDSDPDGKIEIQVTEASKTFDTLVLQEGTLVRETQEIENNLGVVTVPLSNGPIIEGSVSVFVQDANSQNWSQYDQVDNIYFASGSNDSVFQLITDEEFNGSILFGDGVVGSLPSIGSTVRVYYRVGGGSRGNIQNEYINIEVSCETDDGVGTYKSDTAVLENVSEGTGGSNAETVEKAKRYAPLTFRRQDRLVTLEDIKSFGNSYLGTFGTVGKVTAATRKAYGSANIIDIYTLEKANDLQLRRATPQFKLDLLDEMNKKKMITTEFVMVDGLIRTLDLVVTLKIDSGLQQTESIIKNKARNIIQDFFNVDNMDYGKSVYLQDLNREIFELPEARFSTIDNLDGDIHVAFNEIIQLNNLTINVDLV